MKIEINFFFLMIDCHNKNNHEDWDKKKFFNYGI